MFLPKTDWYAARQKKDELLTDVKTMVSCYHKTWVFVNRFWRLLIKDDK
ncbi:MAG: hypothetical protein RHS_1938 [Robinsoniella sp. RHS]|nr:MAG: hypothetical protein RHS_1938 [Robinsoniella sp. RHS]